MIQITGDFNLEDYRCKCCGMLLVNDNLGTLIDKVQDVRSSLKMPLVINSAFRCPKHNAEVGGKPDSWHLISGAADIAYFNQIHNNPDDLQRLKEAMMEVEFKGIGVNPYAFFIHGDFGKIREWTYDINGKAV